jgi:hypothetical protein
MQVYRVDFIIKNNRSAAPDDDYAVGVPVHFQGGVASGLNFKIPGMKIQVFNLIAQQ